MRGVPVLASGSGYYPRSGMLTREAPGIQIYVLNLPQ